MERQDRPTILSHWCPSSPMTNRSTARPFTTPPIHAQMVPDDGHLGRLYCRAFTSMLHTYTPCSLFLDAQKLGGSNSFISSMRKIVTRSFFEVQILMIFQGFLSEEIEYKNKILSPLEINPSSTSKGVPENSQSFK